MSTRTIRVKGENIGMHDTVVVSFATAETVALVGIVGMVERIRVFDEFTGEALLSSHGHDPQLWFLDRRTQETVGPVRRSEIETIGQIDGPWCSPAEMEAMQ